jgi:hypothetical protein
MIFPMDVGVAPHTISGMIHDAAGPPTFLSLSVGMFFVSLAFQTDKKWRPLYRASLMFSVVFLAAFIATFLSYITGSGFLGLAQRIALAAVWHGCF